MARPRIKFRSLRVTPEFRDFVLDQLARLPQLRSKPMFGGVGLYSGECFFGIVAADELFFKVDHSNRAAYEAAGSEPFRPVAARPVSMSYWRVPIEVLEDHGRARRVGARGDPRRGQRCASKPKRKAKPKADEGKPKSRAGANEAGVSRSGALRRRPTLSAL